VYGPEHPQVAFTLTILGVVQRKLGEPELARATLERALAILEPVLGREHLQVARVLGNLGLAQQDLGELAAAKDLCRQAQEILEKRLGVTHPDARWAAGLLQSLD
jgi:tetratricopeptide (TPR) repeat protein